MTYNYSTAASGTLLCGLAPSMNVLIVARAIAGMGGGGYVRTETYERNCQRLNYTWLHSVFTGSLHPNARE